MVGKLHEITASAVAEATKKAGGATAPQLEIKKQQPSAMKVPTIKAPSVIILCILRSHRHCGY